MRIAYGVMGYGRGHAARAAAVLPALSQNHEIVVFAGGDAYDFLAGRFPTIRIPTLGYVYGGRSAYSYPATFGRNLSPMMDLTLRIGSFRRVVDEMRRLRIELVISDSEAWTHRAARELGLPRISFDHIGVIAWCEPHFPPDLWLAGQRDAKVYRWLMGEPDRAIISSFYPATPCSSRVTVVGPLLRERVLRAVPEDAGFLLAYFNKGPRQYRAHVDRALKALDLPVVVYGTDSSGTCDGIDFRPIDEVRFAEDLARCRAVLCTAGNQLIGEALHLRKPLLVMPEDAFEQRLNASMVDRMNVGMRASLAHLTASDIDCFLGRIDEYRRNMPVPDNGFDAALSALQRDIDELAAGTAPAPALQRMERRAKATVTR